MMRTKLRAALAAFLLAAAAAAPLSAQTSAQTSGPVPAALAERLQSLYPATRFGAVNPTPWNGVYEVTMGANLAYVDESGRFFLFGHLFDMPSQRDLTAERKDTLARIDFRSLPLADALKEVRGSGARMLAIFADPDCPYCRRLEAEMRGMTDVTIYTFLMPIPSLHPEARGKAIAIWCASDRIATWHALMWQNQNPAPRDCAHPVDRNMALGEQLGISGTPTLVAGDGRILPGAASSAQIEAWLGRGLASADGPAASAGATR